MMSVWTLKGTLIWLGFSCVCGLASFVVGQEATQKEDGVLPLPNWEQEEVQIFPLGGGLLPRDGSRPSNDAGLFIPKTESQPEPDKESNKKEALPLVDVGALFLEQLDARVAGEYVMDPAQLLVGADFEEVNRLLATQAMEGRVKPHLVMLPERHRLPKSVDMGKLARMSEMGGMTCMVVYPMGEPWRVRLFMSRSVLEVVNQNALRELAQACIQDAMRSEHPVEQLKRFVIQLCVRLTWMEREHALLTVEPSTLTAEPMTERQGGEAEAHEVLEVTVPKEQPLEVTRWEQWWQTVRKWTVIGLVGLGLLWIVRRLMNVVIRKWKQRKEAVMWKLPEVKGRPRLGGKHCGGGGAAVEY